MCGQNGRKAAKSLCVFWPCGGSVVLVGLFVSFRWPVNTWLRVGVLEAQDGGAVGVAWPFPLQWTYIQKDKFCVSHTNVGLAPNTHKLGRYYPICVL